MAVFYLTKLPACIQKNLQQKNWKFSLWDVYGCVVALSSPEKPTYLLVDLPPDAENASALLEFTQMYINNRKGAFMWEKLPKELESAIFASIPSVLTKPEG